MSRFEWRDYISKQIRFSLGNIPSIPVGLFLLWFFTSELGIYYLISSLLSMAVTTVMNLWIQIALKVVKVKQKEPANP